jgi:acyl carrier protein
VWCPACVHPLAGVLAAQSFLTSGGSVMGTGDSGEVTVRPKLDRRQAMSVVSDALTTVLPDLTVEALDERQELADLGLDSLGLARVLIDLEGKLGVQLVDEYLTTIELETVADLVALVEHNAPPAAK